MERAKSEHYEKAPNKMRRSEVHTLLADHSMVIPHIDISYASNLWLLTKEYAISFFNYQKRHFTYMPGPYIAGGRRGPPPGKLNVFFSNIVSDFAGLFLVAILVRNLTKTKFAPADKKS